MQRKHLLCSEQLAAIHLDEAQMLAPWSMELTYTSAGCLCWVMEDESSLDKLDGVASHHITSSYSKPGG